MYVSFVFLGYIFAVFLALIGIALIVLVVMKNRVETTERFKSVRNFSVSILLISVLYFFFYCRENVQEIYEIPGGLQTIFCAVLFSVSGLQL